MDRIESYEDLSFNIVKWLKDYYWDNNLKTFVVGVSGGMIAGQAEPTIIQPSQYKNRFRLAMERNFMGVPDKYDF